LGRIGLSPASPDRELVTRADVEKRELVDAKHRMQMQVASLSGLPTWVLQPCYRGEIPVFCLLGLQECSDTQACLVQRIAAYPRREAVTVDA
jgi:hypothetical protein